MRPAWVAGSVRAALLTSRRLGTSRARQVASSVSLDEALQALAVSPYGREMRPGMSLEAAQHGVAAVTLWHLRILSGWLPPAGLGVVRALAAWFELANVQDRLAYFAGEARRPAFELGALGTAWTQLARTTSPEQLRAVLAETRWRDPGTAEAGGLAEALRAAWASWVVAAVPEAAGWARAGAALALARTLSTPGLRAAHASPIRSLARTAKVGSGWEAASSPAALAALLPRELAWALRDAARADDLWLAEARWWDQVEREAGRLAARHDQGRPVVVGAVVLLAADARRVRAALAVAAVGAAAREAFDALW
jgi:hypothetical protein